MPPSSSPDSPFPDPNSPDSAPRRLLSPQERFGSSETVPQAPQLETPDPFVADPFVAEVPPQSMRLEDEMARRHLPPHLRRRHERTLRKREKREARQRLGSDGRHEKRSQLERDFVAVARNEPPLPRRKVRRRVPKVLKRLLWLVALLFCVQLGFAAFSAPQFAIQSVAIVGAKVTPTEQLRPLALRLIGQNFLRANRGAVEQAALSVPTVASARVVRVAQWPPRVELHVTERRAVLQVGAGQNWWVVDSDGVPFRRAGAADGGLYSVVAPQFSPLLRQPLPLKDWQNAAALNAAILADNKLVKGENVENANATADATASVSSSAAISDAFWQLRRIYFDKFGLASLRLIGRGALAGHDEMLVRLGDDRWSEKLACARSALAYFDRTGRRAQELDLVSLERPVWHPFPAQIAAKSEADSVMPRAG